MPDSNRLEHSQIIDDKDSQSDQLHGVLQAKIQTPAKDWNRDDHRQVRSFASHPNVTTDHLTKLYAHVMPEGREADGVAADTVKSIFESGKAASADAEDYIKRTWKKHDDYSIDDSHEAAAKVGGVSLDLLKEITQKALDDHSIDTVPKYKLPAEFLHQKFSEREDSNPEEGVLNESQKQHNKKMSKLDQLFFNNINDAEHSPEEIQQTVDTLTRQLPLIGTNKIDETAAAQKFIQREDLNATQIEKLFNKFHDPDGRGYRSEEIAEHALNNPNVSPDFVSKIALSPNETYGENARESALKSPNLPQATVDRIINDYNPENPQIIGSSYYGETHLQLLAKNPKATPETLTKIYEKGTKKDKKTVISNPNTAPETIEDFWSKQDKKTDSTKHMLSNVPNVPASVLSDIVGKNKNQELSIQALKHQNADISVVNAGLKRRAADVQAAAALHPLVAKQQINDRLSDGRLNAHDFIFDGKIRNASGDITPEQVAVINEQYKEKPDSEYSLEDYAVKHWLATSDDVDQETQERNKNDILSTFATNVGEADNPYSNNHYGDRNGNKIAAVVLRMAHDGDADSQEAILTKPNLLKSVDYTKDGLNSEFLGKAYAKLDEVFPGDDDSRDLHDRRMRIIENSSAPQEVFDAHTLNPENYKSNSSMNSGNYRSWGSSDKKAKNTVFDERYAEASDDERAEGFQKVLDLNNPEANYAVAVSSSAPDEHFNKAFARLTPEDKAALINRDSWRLKSIQDNMYSDMIAGKHNGQTKKLQEAAISGMNINNPAHATSLSNLISSVYSQNDPYNTPGFIQAQDLVNLYDKSDAPDEKKYGENFKPILETALRVDENLGVKFALKAAITDKDKDPEEKVQNLKTTFEKSSVDQNSLNNKWHLAIESGLRVSDSAKGSLDFLYNLPGDAENGFAVRDAGISKNLFSKNIMEQAALESPTGFENTLKGYKTPERNRLIRDTMMRDRLDPGMVDVAMEKIDPTTIMPESHYSHYSTSKLSDNEFQQSLDNMNVLAAGIIRHKKTDKIPDLADRLTTEVSYNRKARKFNKANQKKLIGALMDSVDTHPDLTPSQKNKIKFDTWDRLNNRNKGTLMSAATLKDVAAGVIAQGDVDTMIDMIDRMDNPPASVQKAISKYMKKPESLTSEQMMHLGNMVKADNANAETSKGILNAISKRASEETNAELAQDMHSKVISLAKGMTKNSKESMMLEGSTIINKYLNSTDPEIKYQAIGAAANIARNHQMPMKERVSTFLNIPSEMEGRNLDDAGNIRYDSEFLNNEEVLLASTHGWKADMYLHNSDVLNDNTASVVADRTIATHEGEEGLHTRKTLLSNLFKNPSVGDETKRKLLDSLDPYNKFHAVSSVAQRDRHRFIDGGAYVGLKDSADYLEDIWSTAKTAGGAAESEAISNLFNSMAQMNGIMHILDKNEQNPSVHEAAGQEAIDEYTSRSLKVASDIHARMISKIENSPEEVSAGEFESYIKGLGSYSDTLLDPKRPLGDNSKASLNIAMGIKDVMNAYSGKHGRDKTVDHSGFSNDSNFYDHFTNSVKNWTRKSTVDDKDWDSIMKRMPEAAFFLGHRPEISGSALKAVDLKKIAEKHPEHIDTFMGQLDEWPERVSMEDHEHLVNFSKEVLNNIDTASYARSAAQFYSKVATTVREKLSYEDLSNMMKSFGNSSYGEELLFKAAGANAGGSRHLHDAIDYSIAKNNKGLSTFINSATLDDAAIDKVMPAIFAKDRDADRDIEAITENGTLNLSAILKIKAYADQAGSYNKKKIIKKIQQHPNIDFDTFNDLYHETKDQYGDHHFNAGTKFNPAFKNRKFGGRLFREQPVTIPDDQPDTVDRSPDRMVNKVEHSKEKAALRSVAELIPPEGISYGQFKGINKQLAEVNAVKEMFMAAKKQHVMPEDVSRAVEQAGGDYHITYATWASMQRHMSGDSRANDKKFANLVMQLNTGEHMEQQLSSDPKLWAFFQMVQAAGNRTNGDQVGGHPVTPHNAAWIRIDTSGGQEGWVIEEFQSDFSSSLRSQIKSIAQSHPEGLTLDGQFYHPEELAQHAKKVEKIISGWHEAAVKAATEMCRRQGVKNLFLHGEGVRSTMSFGSGSGERENPVWMQHMYTKHPKKNGWESVDYTDYPNYSESMRQQASKKPQGTKCWKLKIS